MKSYHIDEIKELGCTLIITVDNGITSIAEALHAKELGIDMIITDHHKPLEVLPTAYAVINPHLSTYKGSKEICGAAVAFKVCM
ncbi:DHH family phosphoesterase [Patescibacteria group bacterium]|nr:DHH family phosphoesterase [Patescibacteria group bacterium]